MSSSWPRNIVPYTEEKLKALSTVESVALYSAAIDSPLVESELTPEQVPIAVKLIKAGLLLRQGAELHPSNKHQRDPETNVPGVVEHKRAVVGFMGSMLDETRRALDEKGHTAVAALGSVVLPDDPETLARAVAILAETEDQLRALAEEEKPNGRGQIRVVVYVGSRG